MSIFVKQKIPFKVLLNKLSKLKISYQKYTTNNFVADDDTLFFTNRDIFRRIYIHLYYEFIVSYFLTSNHNKQFKLLKT